MKAKALILALSMLGAVGTSIALTPKQLYTKDHKPEITLEELIPKSFGDWKLDPTMVQQVVNPQEIATLSLYYSDVLSRAYINSRGERIMLSLAYGADQTRAMQVHKPEICYVNQGFTISYSAKGLTKVDDGAVPVMRLVARQGPRNEPITYWIRSGDYIVRGWLEQNLARVKNGLLKGHGPDGLLVRISTIDPESEHAYSLHDQFVGDLVKVASTPARKMLLGDEQDLQR